MIDLRRSRFVNATQSAVVLTIVAGVRPRHSIQLAFHFRIHRVHRLPAATYRHMSRRERCARHSSLRFRLSRIRAIASANIARTPRCNQVWNRNTGCLLIKGSDDSCYRCNRIPVPRLWHDTRVTGHRSQRRQMPLRQTNVNVRRVCQFRPASDNRRQNAHCTTSLSH